MLKVTTYFKTINSQGFSYGHYLYNIKQDME